IASPQNAKTTARARDWHRADAADRAPLADLHAPPCAEQRQGMGGRFDGRICHDGIEERANLRLPRQAAGDECTLDGLCDRRRTGGDCWSATPPAACAVAADLARADGACLLNRADEEERVPAPDDARADAADRRGNGA